MLKASRQLRVDVTSPQQKKAILADGPLALLDCLLRRWGLLASLLATPPTEEPPRSACPGQAKQE
jgi:hypothetical protein